MATVTLKEMNEWLDMPERDRMKQVELMMHGCKSGKKMMGFLKQEGYKIEPQVFGRTNIDRENKAVNLVIGHNCKEDSVIELIQAACMVKQEKYNPELTEFTKLEGYRNRLRDADVQANTCLFIHEMDAKHPKLKENYLGQYSELEIFEETFRKTKDTNIARSAVMKVNAPETFAGSGIKKPEDYIPLCKDFDGKSYFVDPAEKTKVNAVAIAKAKGKGR